MENPAVRRGSGVDDKKIVTLSGSLPGNQDTSGGSNGIDPNACYISLCAEFLSTLGKSRLIKSDVMITFQSIIKQVQAKMDEALKELQTIGNSMKDITDKMGKLTPFAKLMINIGIMVGTAVLCAGIGAVVGAAIKGAMAARAAYVAAEAAEGASKAVTMAESAVTAAADATKATEAASQAAKAADTAQKAAESAQKAVKLTKDLDMSKTATTAAKAAEDASKAAQKAAQAARDAGSNVPTAHVNYAIDATADASESATKISKELADIVKDVKPYTWRSALPSMKQVIGLTSMVGMSVGPQAASYVIPGMGGTKQDYKLQQLQTDQTDQNQKISNLTTKQDSIANGGQRTEATALDQDASASDSYIDICLKALAFEKDYYVHAV